MHDNWATRFDTEEYINCSTHYTSEASTQDSNTFPLSTSWALDFFRWCLSGDSYHLRVSGCDWPCQVRDCSSLKMKMYTTQNQCWLVWLFSCRLNTTPWHALTPWVQIQLFDKKNLWSNALLIMYSLCCLEKVNHKNITMSEAHLGKDGCGKACILAVDRYSRKQLAGGQQQQLTESSTEMSLSFAKRDFLQVAKCWNRVCNISLASWPWDRAIQLRLFLNGSLGELSEDRRLVPHFLRCLHHAHVVRLCSVLLCPPACAGDKSSLYTTLQWILCH